MTLGNGEDLSPQSRCPAYNQEECVRPIHTLPECADDDLSPLEGVSVVTKDMRVDGETFDERIRRVLGQMRFSLRVLDFYLSESFAMNTYENFVLDIVNIDNMKKQQENNNKKQQKNHSKKSQPLQTGTRRWF